MYWKQKANVKWMREGNANTRFFHNTVKERRRPHTIRRIIREDGVECDSIQDIQHATIHYYETLFTASPTDHYEDILRYIPSLVTDEDNTFLLAIPSLQEVRKQFGT